MTYDRVFSQRRPEARSGAGTRVLQRFVQFALVIEFREGNLNAVLEYGATVDGERAGALTTDAGGWGHQILHQEQSAVHSLGEMACPLPKSSVRRLLQRTHLG